MEERSYNLKWENMFGENEQEFVVLGWIIDFLTLGLYLGTLTSNLHVPCSRTHYTPYLSPWNFSFYSSVPDSSCPQLHYPSNSRHKYERILALYFGEFTLVTMGIWDLCPNIGKSPEYKVQGYVGSPLVDTEDSCPLPRAHLLEITLLKTVATRRCIAFLTSSLASSCSLPLVLNISSPEKTLFTEERGLPQFLFIGTNGICSLS